MVVPRSYFHDSSDGQNREICPTSDPSVVHPSNFKSQGQSQDLETATDLHYSDSSKQTSKSSTEIETAYEAMQQLPLRQSDNPPTVEIIDPTTEFIPQNEPNQSRGDKKSYALITTLFTQKYTDIDMCKILFQPLSCAIFYLYLYLYLFLYLFRTHIIQSFSFFYFGGIHISINNIN